MRHPDEGTIHAWLDGALPDREARALEAHVASCGGCAGRVAEARGLLAGASRIVAALDDVPARGSAAAPAARQASRRWWRRPAIGIAATIAVVATGTVLLVTRGPDGMPVVPASPREAVEVARQASGREAGAAVTDSAASVPDAPSPPPEPAAAARAVPAPVADAAPRRGGRAAARNQVLEGRQAPSAATESIAVAQSASRPVPAGAGVAGGSVRALPQSPMPRVIAGQAAALPGVDSARRMAAQRDMAAKAEERTTAAEALRERQGARAADAAVRNEPAVVGLPRAADRCIALTVSDPSWRDVVPSLVRLSGLADSQPTRQALPPVLGFAESEPAVVTQRPEAGREGWWLRSADSLAFTVRTGGTLVTVTLDARRGAIGNGEVSGRRSPGEPLDRVLVSARERRCR